MHFTISIIAAALLTIAWFMVATRTIHLLADHLKTSKKRAKQLSRRATYAHGSLLLILSVSVSLVFFVVYNQQHSQTTTPPPILRIGHRGAMGLAPENTLASFQKALDMHVDVIELDVLVSKTGELIVMHDETVDRTTDGQGKVIDLSLDELRALDAGNEEKIPTLQEACDFIGLRSRVIIELKTAAAVQSVHELIESYIVEKNWPTDHFMVSSADHEAIAAFRRVNQHISLALILANPLADLSALIEQTHIQSVHVAMDMVDVEFLEQARKDHLQIFVWTVNNPVDIQTMKALGVDGIISNYPDRI